MNCFTEARGVPLLYFARACRCGRTWFPS